MDFGSFNWSAAIALIAFLFALYSYRKQSGRANKLRKTEIYQGMEFASNELFGFEAQNNKTLERFRDARPDPDKFTPLEWKILNRYAEIEEKGASEIDPSPGFLEAFRRLEEDIRITRKYYEKTLNMFEVATRFREEGIVEDKVYGSWVIWYYDTCQEWAFRWMWPKLRKNYLKELRGIFDFPVDYFDFESSNPETLNKLEHDFFVHVARFHSCKVVASWLEDAETDLVALRKQAERDGFPRYEKEWPSKYGKLPGFWATRKQPAPRTVTAGFPGGEASPDRPNKGA
ncbi:MAG TPA: hypothetical protein PLN33_02200 [Hyphomonadaceae bacterium]|nr:hypothetical protein [Hyphomonadaceae bacterium]HPN07138.1 hypothetical protein [Hyphomonadaceae bacterium]